MKLEDAIDGMRRACDVDQLFLHYTKAVEVFGFDRVLLALISDHPRLRLSAQHGILSSYPVDWVDYYLSRDYDKIDPVRLEVQRWVAPFTWDQLLASKELTQEQRLLFAEAADAHLHDGLGMPLHGPGGTTAGIGLASSSKGLTISEQTLWTVHNLSMQFYASYWRLHEKPFICSKQISLTPREAEVLRWLASGSTKAEVADRLKISYHTVDYHTRRVLEKFKTRSVTAAVHFATAQGYITLD